MQNADSGRQKTMPIVDVELYINAFTAEHGQATKLTCHLGLHLIMHRTISDP